MVDLNKDFTKFKSESFNSDMNGRKTNKQTAKIMFKVAIFSFDMFESEVSEKCVQISSLISREIFFKFYF